MTDEQIALARRAVACKGWRWMPGMLTADGFRVCRVDADGYKFGYRTEYNYAYAVVGDALPDLQDPATLGCLLALVREAMGDQNICVCWDFFNEMWVCEGAFEYNGNKYLGLIKEAQSYAEALVLTLEDAPCGQ